MTMTRTNVYSVNGLLSLFFSYHQKEKEPLMEDATAAIRFVHAAAPAVYGAVNVTVRSSHVTIKPS